MTFHKCVDPNPYYQRWLYRDTLLTEHFPRDIQSVFACEVDAESL